MSASHGHATFKATGTTGSSTITKPNNVSEGDLLLAFHNCDVGSSLNDLNLSGGSTWNVGAQLFTDPGYFKGYWKRAGSSEPASYTITQNSGADGAVTVIRVADADPGVDPVWATPVGDSAAGATINTPGVTPTGSDDLEYRCACGTGNTTAHEWFFDADTPALTSLTQVSSGDFANHKAAYRSLTSNAATGVITARSRNLANTANVGQGGSRQAMTVSVASATSTLEVTFDTSTGAVTGDFTVDSSVSAELDGSTSPVTGSFTGEAKADVELTGSTSSVTGAFTVDASLSSSLAGQTGSVTGAFTAESTLTNELSGVLSPITGSFLTGLGLELTFDLVVSPVTGAFTVEVEIMSVTLAGQTAPVTGDFSILVRTIEGMGEATPDGPGIFPHAVTGAGVERIYTGVAVERALIGSALDTVSITGVGVLPSSVTGAGVRAVTGPDVEREVISGAEL